MPRLRQHPVFSSRSMEEGDIAAIVALQRHAVEKAWGGYTHVDFAVFLAARFDPAQQAQKYRERLHDKERFVLVVEADGVIAGFGGAKKCGAEDQPPGYEWQGSAFYIAPEYQGTGASLVLFNAVFDELKSRGAKSACGWCFAANMPARNFYARRGAILIENVDVPPEYAEVAPHVAYGVQL